VRRRARGGGVDPFAGTSAARFKTTAVRGGVASVIAYALTFGLQVCSMIVLARLLSPEDFGLQGMVLVVTGFLGVFREAGLSVPSVQRESLTHEQASTLFWINAGIGAVLTLVGAAIAPVLGSFFREPRVLPVALVSSVAFLFYGLAVQHRALLTRSMRFASLARIDVLAMAAGVSVAIVMAACGFKHWALVGMAVVQPFVSLVAVWMAMPWLPGRPSRGSGVGSMIHMGGTVTLNVVVVYVAYNVEKILLGRVWGAEALGLYGRAYQLANLPAQQVISSIGAVAFPALARIQSDGDRVARVFLTGYVIVISILIPFALSCAIFAEEIVHVVLGSRWGATAQLLRLLTPVVLALALVNPFGWLLQATGRVGRSLGMGLLIAPVLVLAVSIGSRYGPAGVAVGYSTGMVMLTIPLIGWARHGTGIGMSAYWTVVKRPLVAGLVGGTIGALTKLTWAHDLEPIGRLAVGSGLFLVVYAWILLVVFGQWKLCSEIVSAMWPRSRERSLSTVDDVESQRLRHTACDSDRASRL
jgi:O-antigen/teichoic acid export membrane protein